MSSYVHRALCVAAIAALSLAACGSDDGDSGDGTDEPAGDALVVEALDSLEFGEDAYSAPTGTIAVSYENRGSLPHTLLVEDHEDAMRLSVTGSGDTDEGSIELEAGEYVMYCDVAGHRGAGMEATLTVE